MAWKDVWKILSGRARAEPAARTDCRRAENGEWIVDVRGQTCPGYLLEINRHVSALDAGQAVILRVSYPPCGEDVRAWCERKEYAFKGVERAGGKNEDGYYEITIET
jgi:TusA-related sulfurtransferase